MLSRAVGLVALNQSDHYILEVLMRRWPDATQSQAEKILQLAKEGLAFTNSIDWSDPNARIYLSKAPRLPRK